MKWYKNKRISTKLIIGFLVIALISVIVGSVGFLNITSMEKASTQLYQENALSLQRGGAAATNFQMVRYSVLRLITYATDEDITSGTSYAKDMMAVVEADLADLGKIILSEEGKAHLATIKTEWMVYKATTDKYISFISAHDSAKALKILEDELALVGTTIRDTFTVMMTDVSSNAYLKAEDNTRLAQMSMLIMAGAVGFGVIISILLGVYISRLIGRPLKAMAENARKLALGDVDLEIKADTRDEIGELAEAFNTVVNGRKQQVQETRRLATGDLTVDITMASEKDVLNQSLITLVDNLNDIVSTIRNSAEQVASGSNLVSQTSMALSQGSTEQASSVEQLTASLQEIASQTTLNAQNAQSANEYAKNAKEDAEQGNAQMKDMLVAMEEINQSSAGINKIIKVIDDIAFQTNILALNAAVEAARAGQHGKGFAVVAEEVRTLAARSAQAAKETTDMIEGSIKKVEAGTRIANATAEALSKIVTEVAKAAALVEEIAAASNEQAAAIEQVNQGVIMVSTVVQSNAATSEESAAASEELSSQADQLKEVISQFKIKHDAGRIGLDAIAQKVAPMNSVKALSAGLRHASQPSRPAIILGNDDFGKY